MKDFLIRIHLLFFAELGSSRVIAEDANLHGCQLGSECRKGGEGWFAVWKESDQERKCARGVGAVKMGARGTDRREEGEKKYTCIASRRHHCTCTLRWRSLRWRQSQRLPGAKQQMVFLSFFYFRQRSAFFSLLPLSTRRGQAGP